jgi:hypothetical protein
MTLASGSLGFEMKNRFQGRGRGWTMVEPLARLFLGSRCQRNLPAVNGACFAICALHAAAVDDGWPRLKTDSIGMLHCGVDLLHTHVANQIN